MRSIAVQGVFQHVKGVSNAVSGYAGGAKCTAVYELTNDGTTGHADSVQLTFDLRQVPKTENLKRLLPALYRAAPVLVSSLARLLTPG